MQFNEGATILEVATAAGIFIPTLCYKKELQPSGGCGVCTVEDINTGNLLPACATCAQNDQNISTTSDRVIRLRKSALVLLLSDHPADCEAPCQMACPSGLPVQRMLESVAAGKWDDARRIALQYPFVCGDKVDDTPCERVCRRSKLGGAVAICAIHRYLCSEEYPVSSDKKSDQRKFRRTSTFRSRMRGLSAEEMLSLAAEKGDRAFKGGATMDQDAMRYEARRCLQCGCERPDNCELRDLCAAFDVKQPPASRTNRRIYRERGAGGFRFDSSRCILCERCVRAAARLNVIVAPGIQGRGFDSRIAPPLARSWDDIDEKTLRVCVQACPTGAMAMR